MIGTIRKHQKWLWYIIIGVTIVTFVVFFSPSAGRRGSGGGASQVDLGSVDGIPVTPEAYLGARNEERMDFRLHYNQWPPADESQLRQAGFNLTAQTYHRLFLNAKADELKIQVTDEAVLRKMKQMFGLKPEQAMPVEKLNEFVTKELIPNNISLLDFQRYARNRVAHEQLIAIYGMGGQLITPKEAQSFYLRENEPVTATVALFSFSNYLAQVTPTDADLQGYYRSNQALYRIREKVAVQYVLFSKTNFYDEVIKTYTNLDQIINNVYKEQGAAAFKDKDGTQMTEADSKALVKKQILEIDSLTLARRKAAVFLNTLDLQCSNAHPFSLAVFEELASKQGLSVRSTEPFDETEGPAMKATSEFVQAAFGLTDSPRKARDSQEDTSKRTLFYRRPLSGEDGAYAIALKERVPSRVRSFEEVKDEVIRDYKREKAIDLAITSGEQFGIAATNGIAAGKSFAEIAEAVKIKTVDLPPFSMATKALAEVDKNTLQELQHAVSELSGGKASGFNQQLEGGFVVFVKSKGKVDDAKMQAELPAYIEQMRANRQYAAFNEWFSKHFNQSVHRPPEKNPGPGES